MLWAWLFETGIATYKKAWLTVGVPFSADRIITNRVYLNDF